MHCGNACKTPSLIPLDAFLLHEHCTQKQSEPIQYALRQSRQTVYKSHMNICINICRRANDRKIGMLSVALACSEEKWKMHKLAHPTQMYVGYQDCGDCGGCQQPGSRRIVKLNILNSRNGPIAYFSKCLCLRWQNCLQNGSSIQ